MRRACSEGHREPRVRARGRDPGVLARQGFPAPSRDGGGRRGRKPPPRDLVVASDSIASRARGRTRDARRVARHERRAVGSRTRRSRLGGPGGDHAGTRPSRRVGEPETRGTATTRRHGRCAGAGCGRSTPWGGTHHVCYVRLCVLALRGVKLRGVACGAGDVLVFLLAEIHPRFSALFSHTGPVRDPPIKQLNTYSLLLHY